MHKLFFIFGISLVIERALEQLSEFIPRKKRKRIMWFLSLIFSFIITFLGKIGILREIGILHGEKEYIFYIDYLLTGLIISSGSEPVHSIIISLENKKEELKQKVKRIEKN